MYGCKAISGFASRKVNLLDQRPVVTLYVVLAAAELQMHQQGVSKSAMIIQQAL